MRDPILVAAITQWTSKEFSGFGKQAKSIGGLLRGSALKCFHNICAAWFAMAIK